MRAHRLLLAGAATAFLFLGLAVAADPIQIQIQPAPGANFVPRSGGLLSPDGIEKLKLTAEQKEKFGKIEGEFKEKQQAAGEKLREAFQSKDQDKIKEALQGQRADAGKLRTEYLTKVEALLSDEQKKVFEEAKKEQPRAIGRPFAPPVGGQVLPPAAQEKLKLTDEQKKKVEDLQKELEAKIMNVLTEDQKKQYEEMKKVNAQPNPAIQLRRLNPNDK